MMDNQTIRAGIASHNFHSNFINMPKGQFSDNASSLPRSEAIRTVKITLLATKTSYYLSWAGGYSESDKVEISSKFIELNSIEEGALAEVNFLPNTNNQTKRLDLNTFSQEDYEVISSNSGLLERSILGQVRVIQTGVPFFVFVNEHQGFKLVHKAKGGSDGDEAGARTEEYFKIGEDTELAILPPPEKLKTNKGVRTKGLEPFVILRNSEQKNLEKRAGDDEDEDLKPKKNLFGMLNDIVYFQKSSIKKILKSQKIETGVLYEATNALNLNHNDDSHQESLYYTILEDKEYNLKFEKNQEKEELRYSKGSNLSKSNRQAFSLLTKFEEYSKIENFDSLASNHQSNNFSIEVRFLGSRRAIERELIRSWKEYCRKEKFLVVKPNSQVLVNSLLVEPKTSRIRIFEVEDIKTKFLEKVKFIQVKGGHEDIEYHKIPENFDFLSGVAKTMIEKVGDCNVKVTVVEKAQSNIIDLICQNLDCIELDLSEVMLKREDDSRQSSIVEKLKVLSQRVKHLELISNQSITFKIKNLGLVFKKKKKRTWTAEFICLEISE